MTLGDIIQQAIQRDLAAKEIGSNGLSYTELIKDNRFHIKFSSSKHPEATMECSVPYSGTQEEENYCRLYFLSMAFNSAVFGRKRIHNTKRKS
jgi:hypothetical protein